ncbi:hypothetical protein Glove_423g13 [Diversispora epigaea]|uniref:Uncharacterized protein n=1 Tax=Diversispora epigaea TaxID=1348612 RepID=A0A397GYM7_9GLOM|nr:hypothetical protein Glove_423g13 [Diversispora epigaea]
MEHKIPYPDKMKSLQYTKYTPKVTSPYDIIVKVCASSPNGKIKPLLSPIIPGLEVVVAKGNSPEANRMIRIGNCYNWNPR